jgi:MoaA/NifB/PqqE/SkfB family radical SAM enzyme
MLQTIRYKGLNGLRAVRQWVIPYLNSRIHADEFRPVLCYLFTEWRCNIDCHYCFQYDNERPGMDLETAKMGGEPLIRKDFVLEVIRYGAENGFFMYLPTNGYLMDKAFIDEVGRTGVAAINLAVDCVAPYKGLPKALLHIEPQFRYLVERREEYGYLLFFNINICHNNIKDVKILTEIARQNKIGTDYHLNEPPYSFVNVDHYSHQNEDLSITPDKYKEVDELLDWLIKKQRQGWPMVNSVAHLRALKHRMRNRMGRWDCRAGHNGALVRPDGTLSPCFDLISFDQDWGRVWEPKFEKEELQAVKEKCLPSCSSTCFCTMAHYYNLRWIPQWVRKHVRVG